MSAPVLPVTRLVLRGRIARDLMTPAPTCVFNTDPLRAGAEFLARHSAVPVVDTDRRVVGVLSRTDLARALADHRPGAAPTLELERRLDDQGGSTLDYQPPGKRIGDVMTPNVVTITPDTMAVDVVRTLADKRIGRVFVVDSEHHLLGVISTTDIIMRLGVDES
jgi:CBS domain-containing protein